MNKPRVLVFSGYGLNCEEETQFAFQLAGARADIVHINDVIDGYKKLNDYQILAFPGGFSHGDDTGSGNAYAQRLENHMRDEMDAFVAHRGLVIGICNGFQILARLGFVPALHRHDRKNEIALLPNDSARYTVRWVDLTNKSTSPWLTGITTLSLPIAHGEGKLYAQESTLKEMKKNKQIALRYAKGELCTWQSLPANPTGTLDDIAAITDETGKILGMMPHPERAIFFTQLPHWTYLREIYKRKGKRIPTYGPGLRIFQNAVKYFQT